jgi:hypothetical protein
LTRRLNRFKQYLAKLSAEELPPPPLSPLAFANTDFEEEPEYEKEFTTQKVTSAVHVTLVEPAFARSEFMLTLPVTHPILS